MADARPPQRARVHRALPTRHQRARVASLLYLFRSVVVPGHACLLCSARRAHGCEACPAARNVCWRCAGRGHRSSGCTESTGRLRLGDGACWTCGMPQQNGPGVHLCACRRGRGCSMGARLGQCSKRTYEAVLAFVAAGRIGWQELAQQDLGLPAARPDHAWAQWVGERWGPEDDGLTIQHGHVVLACVVAMRGVE